MEIPDELYRKVKSKSALEGRPVREVAIELFRGYVEGHDRPSRRELLDRLARLDEVHLDRSPAELIREERERR